MRYLKTPPSAGFLLPQTCLVLAESRPSSWWVLNDLNDRYREKQTLKLLPFATLEYPASECPVCARNQPLAYDVELTTSHQHSEK